MDNGNMRERLIAWEHLRVVYNAVMLLVGIPIAVSVYHAVHAIPAHMRRGFAFTYTPMSVIGLSIVFGLTANVMYMLGPMAEIYTTAFTRITFGRRGRLVLFSVGLIVSLAVEGILWVFYQMIGFMMD